MFNLSVPAKMVYSGKIRSIVLGGSTILLFLFLLICALYGSMGMPLIDFNLYTNLKFALLFLSGLTIFNLLLWFSSHEDAKYKNKFKSGYTYYRS